MKKECPICSKIFQGRSDKLFCSTVCKNVFHNTKRKQGLVNSIDQDLHQNRAILNQLLPGESEKEVLERVVLERLGFQFDLITGVLPDENDIVKKRIYEYLWMEISDDKVLIERALEEPEE